MSSLSRAVTSKFNDFSNKRQRLVGESTKDTELINPSWSDPSTSDFNYFEPPELIIPEENWRETPILDKKIEEDKTTSPKISPGSVAITKKVSNVVRKLSPFGNNNNNGSTKDAQKEALEAKSEGSAEKGTEPETEKKNNKLFKDTKAKMDKMKKTFRSNDRQQLIESDDEI